MYSRSSTGVSLRSCDIPVSLGEPSYIPVALRCRGSCSDIFCNSRSFIDRVEKFFSIYYLLSCLQTMSIYVEYCLDFFLS
uniref:Putative ovule protein n=1 Tax=Solanum chacoense TaxID=4108 RepID=A0A0V0IG75_SOLCH